jgi:hypothetical protein
MIPRLKAFEISRKLNSVILVKNAPPKITSFQLEEITRSMIEFMKWLVN